MESAFGSWAGDPPCPEKSGRVMAVKHKRVADIDLPSNNRMSSDFGEPGINTERPWAELCDHAFYKVSLSHSLY